jgi:hypothetical protein
LFNTGIIAGGTDKFALFSGVSNVLFITLTRLGIIKFAKVATLRLEMLFAIVAKLDFIAMDKLGVIG